ncbi:holin family protein [Paenibacillus sp. GCM10027627]|uniref:phage holin family protein n=1 Tax=unclassified Paenibacillus TaxID=185978 RepID=UPI00363AEA8B
MSLFSINVEAGVVAGGVGAFVAFAFGHWTEALTFLLIAIGADIVTGVHASFAEGRGLSSSIASVGYAKKGLMLLVIILAHRVDILLGLDAIIMTSSVYFYIVNELVSIIENLGRSGLPLPDKLREGIEVLKRSEPQKRKGNKGENSD